MIELDYIEGIDIIDIFDLLKAISINKNTLAENVNNILMLSHGSKLSIKLNELWEDYCDKEHICSSCGNEIAVIAKTPLSVKIARSVKGAIIVFRRIL